MLGGQCVKACAANRHEKPDFAGNERIHVAKLFTRGVADELPDFPKLLASFSFQRSAPDLRGSMDLYFRRNLPPTLFICDNVPVCRRFIIN
jgi:hypothetical protein